MVTQPKSPEAQEWVLLSYRVPREPSTPRIAIWRKLRELGVAQVVDGLVALPLDARTKEHLEWVAGSALEAGGEAIVWTATPSGRRNSKALAQQMNRDRDDEYQALLAEIEQEGPEPSLRTVNRWRRTWRKIDRRDYFRAPLRDQTRLAIAALAAAPADTELAATESASS